MTKRSIRRKSYKRKKSLKRKKTLRRKNSLRQRRGNKKYTGGSKRKSWDPNSPSLVVAEPPKRHKPSWWKWVVPWASNDKGGEDQF